VITIFHLLYKLSCLLIHSLYFILHYLPYSMISVTVQNNKALLVAVWGRNIQLEL